MHKGLCLAGNNVHVHVMQSIFSDCSVDGFCLKRSLKLC